MTLVFSLPAWPRGRAFLRWPGARGGCAMAGAILATALTGCGAGNPLDNTANVDNSATITGKKLSLAYFQYCVMPVLETDLASPDGGSGVNNCASSGCHNDNAGTGGALRLVRNAAALDVSTADDTSHTTDMYRNFYSGQGVTVPGSPYASRLLAKPLLISVLHGGGLIFKDKTTQEARTLRYWIEHPVPTTSNEFDTGASVQGMFSGDADAITQLLQNKGTLSSLGVSCNLAS